MPPHWHPCILRYLTATGVPPALPLSTMVALSVPLDQSRHLTELTSVDLVRRIQIRIRSSSCRRDECSVIETPSKVGLSTATSPSPSRLQATQASSRRPHGYLDNRPHRDHDVIQPDAIHTPTPAVPTRDSDQRRRAERPDGADSGVYRNVAGDSLARSMRVPSTMLTGW